MVTRLHALLLGALVLAAPATSAGRSPIYCVRPRVELPEDGAEDVPLNARLWFRRQLSSVGDPSDLVLIGPDGTELETTEARIDMVEFQELAVLTPDEPLLPESRYQLWTCRDLLCTSLVSEFTTGTESDTNPPTLPVETDREQGRGWVHLSIDFEGVLIVSLGDLALDPATLTGSAHSSHADDTISFGDDGHYCPDRWPGANRDEQTLRYGAFDLAGNFSGWSEPEPLSLTGCECSADRSNPPLLLPTLLLLLGGPTRRRRSMPS